MNKELFIKDYLQEHVYDNICLQDICEHFHMSKSHVCELFQKEMGKGVIEYYNEMKIQEAKRLIEKGEMNLTQIAEQLGYANIHQFSRSFKNKVGMAPTAFRKLNKK